MAKAKVGTKVYVVGANHEKHKAVITGKEVFRGYPGKPKGFKKTLYHLKCECGFNLGRVLKQLRVR